MQFESYSITQIFLAIYRICLYIVNCRLLTVKIMTVCEDYNVVCVLLCKFYQKTFIEMFELQNLKTCD